jgi:hypothetical protein
MPGPLKDVFSVQPDIVVGPYRVRPFYDGDFENLSALGHPLHKLMVDGMSGKEPPKEMDPMVRGPALWEMAWMLTREIEDTDTLLAKDGKAGVAKAAKREFGKLQFGAVMAISKAVAEQMRIYWSSVLGYGASAEGENSGPPAR